MKGSRINSQGRLCGDAKIIGLAYTFGKYDIGFTTWSQTNNCAAADLIRSRKMVVWGILYDVPDYLLSRTTSGKRRSMDAIEGQNYRRRRIKVFRKNKREEIIKAWTYTVINRVRNLRTSKDYCDFIIDGLIENQAPKTYIKHVKTRIIRNNSELEKYIK
jgi:hypothetical protein